jgi:cytidine deaminase
MTEGKTDMKPPQISEADALALARQVAQNAYAPYSHFRVGAVAVGAMGTYTGVNVENASFGLALCAERAALTAALAAGERTISAIAVACIDAAPSDPVESRLPCGACRQWLAELAPQAKILIDGHTFTLDELLPKPFSLKRPE